MATKSPELLPNLPSVSELLESPPVRQLLRSVNRSAVTRGVRSYLDQLRDELQDRLADVSLPTPAELAERAARFVVGDHEPQYRSIINATGRVVGGDWSTVPLAPAARHAMLSVAEGFTTPTQARCDKLIEQHLRRSTNAEAALVVHSYGGAVWLVVQALAGGQGVVVAKSEVNSVIRAATGAMRREAGAIDSCTCADYEATIDDDTSLLLRVRSDACRAVGTTISTTREELVALARDREIATVEALDGAPLCDATNSELESANARDALKAGIDLVVVRGEGRLGGPPAGIVLGDRPLLERIRCHEMYSAWQLDPLRAAALGQSLRPDNGPATPPVRQLLETSVDNLRHRAERMAVQLIDSCPRASIQAVPLTSPVAAHSDPSAALPSFGLSLVPRDGNVETLAHHLQSQPSPILCLNDAQQVTLDLRTVLPAQDAQIVAALQATPDDA